MGLLYTLEPYRYVPLVPLSPDWIAAFVSNSPDCSAVFFSNSPHAFTGNQSHSNFFQLTQNFILGAHCKYLDFCQFWLNLRNFFGSFSQRYASQFLRYKVFFRNRKPPHSNHGTHFMTFYKIFTYFYCIK